MPSPVPKPAAPGNSAWTRVAERCERLRVELLRALDVADVRRDVIDHRCSPFGRRDHHEPPCERRSSASSEPASTGSSTSRDAATRTRAGIERSSTTGRTVFVKSAVDELSAGWLRIEIAVYTTLRGSVLARLPRLGRARRLPADRARGSRRRALAAAVARRRHRRRQAGAARDSRRARRRLASSRCRAPTSLTSGARSSATQSRSSSTGVCTSRVARRAPAASARRRRARAVRRERSPPPRRPQRQHRAARRARRARRLELGLHRQCRPRRRRVGAVAAFRGRPAPEDFVAGAGIAELAAALAGFWAARVGLPPPPTAPRVRVGQRQQLAVALPWACRLLGIAEP